MDGGLSVYPCTEAVSSGKSAFQHLMPVMAILVAVVVLEADFHAAPGSVSIGVTPIILIPLRAVPVPVPISAL